MNPQAQLPGSPAGTPPNPGASPMAAPGAGGGNTAAAAAQVKAVCSVLIKLLGAFPVGSKENAAVSRAYTALSPIAGKTEESLVPSAIQQMALASKGSPLKAAPPIAIQPSAPPGGASPPEGE